MDAIDTIAEQARVVVGCPVQQEFVGLCQVRDHWSFILIDTSLRVPQLIGKHDGLGDEELEDILGAPKLDDEYLLKNTKGCVPQNRLSTLASNTLIAIFGALWSHHLSQELTHVTIVAVGQNEEDHNGTLAVVHEEYPCA